jgi:membrane fusion protein (multidrug efflux system)
MLAEEDFESSLDEGQPVRAPQVARETTPDSAPELPVQPPARPKTDQAGKDESGSRPWVRRALFLLLPVALSIGGYWYVTGGRLVSTDDAYVNADKVGISTDVSGTVAEIQVRENQEVLAGQGLYRLDPLQLQIAVANDRANRDQIVLTLDSMKRDYRRMLTDVAAEQSQVVLDQTRYDRAKRLLVSGIESRANYDQMQYTLQTDQSKLEALREQARVQLARLGGNLSTPVEQLPQYMQAQAQLAEATRELGHTVVRAPFAGTVTDVSSIAPGRYLPASTTAFHLVDTDHVWIDATPKETQLTYVRVGQPVAVTVDTYPNVRWHGTVDSLSPAAAQEFSLLPAENTSGNWVKVVQRVTMRIRVDTSAQDMPPLRAGMSAEVHVDTGHRRGLPRVLTALF